MAQLPVVHIADVLADYLRWIEVIKRRSAGTLRKHREYLARLDRRWGPRDLTRVKDTDIAILIAERMGDVSPSTLNGDVYVLRSFFRWLHHRGVIRRDPAAELEYERIASIPRWRLEVEQFSELLDNAPHPRDRALFATGLFTLLRIGEICDLRIGDLVEVDGVPYLNQRIFKTRQVDQMRIDPAYQEELDAYLSWYKRSLGVTYLDASWYLLPGTTNPGRYRDDQDLHVFKGNVRPKPLEILPDPQHKIQYALGRMGLPTKMEGGHTLRRSGARGLYNALVEEGVADPLSIVQYTLHHASPQMTAHYIGVNTFRQRRDDRIGKGMYPKMQKQQKEETAIVLPFSRRREAN